MSSSIAVHFVLRNQSKLFIVRPDDSGGFLLQLALKEFHVSDSPAHPLITNHRPTHRLITPQHSAISVDSVQKRNYDDHPQYQRNKSKSAVTLLVSREAESVWGLFSPHSQTWVSNESEIFRFSHVELQNRHRFVNMDGVDVYIEGFVLRKEIIWRKRFCVLRNWKLTFFDRKRILDVFWVEGVERVDAECLKIGNGQGKWMTLRVDGDWSHLLHLRSHHFLESVDLDSYSQPFDSHHVKSNSHLVKSNSKQPSRQLQPNEIKCDKVGLLLKQGSINRTFQRRLFVLRDKVLFYFKVARRHHATSAIDSSTKFMNFINLEACRVTGHQLPSKRQLFRIISPHRTFTLATVSLVEWQDWKDAFEFICGLEVVVVELLGASVSTSDLALEHVSVKFISSLGSNPLHHSPTSLESAPFFVPPPPPTPLPPHQGKKYGDAGRDDEDSESIYSCLSSSSSCSSILSSDASCDFSTQTKLSSALYLNWQQFGAPYVEGMLSKRGKDRYSAWRTRFAILQSRSIFYFHDKHLKSLLGSIPLSFCTLAKPQHFSCVDADPLPSSTPSAIRRDAERFKLNCTTVSSDVGLADSEFTFDLIMKCDLLEKVVVRIFHLRAHDFTSYEQWIRSLAMHTGLGVKTMNQMFFCH